MEITGDDTAVAIYVGDRLLQYAELRRRVESAEDLPSGAHAGEVVPLVESDAETLILRLLECLHVGAVACPLNPRWPAHEIGAVTEHLSSLEFVSAESGGVIVRTSGSAGAPKATVLSEGDLTASACVANDHFGLGPGDSWLLSLPLYHVGGLGIVFRCLTAGAAIVVSEEGESLAESLDRYAPTHLSLVATQLYRLLQDDRSAASLARTKAVLLGGSAVPEALVREAHGRGIPIYTSYGMTETASMIACTRPADSIEHLLTSGRPLTEGTVSISDEGEILVRGQTLFQGYLQPDGSLDLPLTEDGWFATGDLGFIDDEGYLHVTGRKDNMFISGGENIQPEEVERALSACEGVDDAVVVPVDDPEWGQRAVAFVRTTNGEALDQAALIAALRESLPGYKVPKTFLAWPTDLESGEMKISRAEFADRALDAQER